MQEIPLTTNDVPWTLREIMLTLLTEKPEQRATAEATYSKFKINIDDLLRRYHKEVQNEVQKK